MKWFNALKLYHVTFQTFVPIHISLYGFLINNDGAWKKSVLIDTKGFQTQWENKSSVKIIKIKKKQKLFSNFLMIPFSRILLCLTLHYFKREKERLSTCINNAFTSNYFCFFFTFFVLFNGLQFHGFISLLLYFCTFFPTYIIFLFFYFPSTKQVQFFMLYSKQAQPRENKKFQLYNCTHPCTPMRLYFSTAIPFKF